MGKKSRKKKNSSNQDAADAAVADERFAMAKPHFQSFSQKSRHNTNSGSSGLLTTSSNKIVLDERFSSVLTDSRFQLQEKDKYGRKKRKNKQKNQKNKELDAFYTVADDDDNEEEKEKHEKEKDDASSTSGSTESSNDSDDNNNDQDDDAVEDPASRISYLTALSRGELDVSSSSSDDDGDSDVSSDNDDDSSVEAEDPIHGTAGILDPSAKKEAQVEITFEQSPYLAVTNLDWNHMRAVDIFAILSSFSPPGTLNRVQVFLSDYGKQKMQQEMQHGPPSLWKKKKKTKIATTTSESDEDDDSEESSSEEEEEENDNQNDNEESDMDDDADEPPLAETYEDFIDAANEQHQKAESDFDPEKLRAYEASKLKYYFAVAEFASNKAADVAYKEVDGMEFEHSSAAVDMRSIPKEEINNVTDGRELRDEATSMPGDYMPPAFIVSALQQTSVQCTWEAGDSNRERLLTKYTSAEQWAACAENDDLKAYLASDASSEEEDDSDNDSDAPNAKGARLRKLLGLDNDNDDDGSDAENSVGSGAAGAGAGAGGSDSDSDDGGEVSKEIKYDPNKADLQEKIRAKLEAKDEAQQKELSPWEKYKEKRKEKRKERRQAGRRKRDDMELEDKGAKRRGGKRKESDDQGSDDDGGNNRKKLSKEELELLLAGDNDEEVSKDFDMRGLQRIEKNKDKRLRGSRKRKEEKLAAGVSGQQFEIDLKDNRFAAVLDGDDGRFGIDRTDSQYKETPAMREILQEQKARRKKRRTTKSTDKPKQKPVPKDVVEGANMKSSGSAALSSLVKSLKTKVAKT